MPIQYSLTEAPNASLLSDLLLVGLVERDLDIDVLVSMLPSTSRKRKGVPHILVGGILVVEMLLLVPTTPERIRVITRSNERFGACGAITN